MATTNFKGQPVKLIGEFIQVGKVAPDFELVKTDLSSFSLKDLNGKNVILNIFPSLDTSVCATSVRKFNKMAAGLKDTVVLAISKDLPFAHGRFCTTEGIENVIPLSDFRFSDFDESYGVRMADGPLAGLLARAVVVIGYPMVSMEVIPFIIAFWLMFRGFSSTGYSIDLKRYGTRDWGWYMAFGILAILCSLLILWQPAIGALYAVYMISFTFLIIGLFRVMLSFELKNLHKRK